MKCPVCHTKTNEAVCPNCGYILKKDNYTYTYKETNTKKIDFHNLKEKYDNLSFYRQQRYIRLVIFIFMLIVFAFCTVMSTFNTFIDKNFSDHYGVYNAYDALDILKDDSIITKGQTHDLELVNTFNDLSFTIDKNTGHIHEIYNLKNDLFGKISREAHKINEHNDKITYTLDIEYDLDKIRHVTVHIKGLYDGHYNDSLNFISKTDVDTFFHTFINEEGYDILKQTKQKFFNESINNTKDEYTTGYQSDDYEIWLNETYSSHYNKTNFYYTITK